MSFPLDLRVGDVVTVERRGLAGWVASRQALTVCRRTAKYAFVSHGTGGGEQKVRLSDGIVFPKYLDYTTTVVAVAPAQQEA